MSARKQETKSGRSEATKAMPAAELAELEKNVEDMTEEELQKFRNGFDPDTMGFDGEEAPKDAGH